MIEDISTYKLKCNHTGPHGPLQHFSEQKHAWITDYETSLPSEIVFQITLEFIFHDAIQLLVDTDIIMRDTTSIKFRSFSSIVMLAAK